MLMLILKVITRQGQKEEFIHIMSFSTCTSNTFIWAGYFRRYKGKSITDFALKGFTVNWWKLYMLIIWFV